ncbi:MAG: hypothetical protein AB7G47_10235 [Mycolicibacterium sp.]|uniref:hypothetical protein n=1 Tax=Mycolicibacterium sp. TaxID=2320850 RepID=UPI003D0D896A
MRRYLLGSAIVFVVAVWVLWRTEPRQVPNLNGFAAVAGDWPSATIDPGFAYTLRVPLGQMVYQLLPHQNPTTFYLLHFACLLLVAALIGVWLFKRIGAHQGMLAACILLLAPITPVLLLWVGMYDAFSMLAWTLLLISLDHGRRAQFAAAALAGFQNFEQSLVGMLVLLLIPALWRGAGWAPRVIALLAGLVAGKVLLELLLSDFGAVAGDRISYLLDDGKGFDLVTSATSALPVLLWSALGGLWIFAVLGLRAAWGSWDWRRRAMLAAAFTFWMSSGVLAEDQTRVLALTSFPAVMAGAIILASRYQDVLRFAGHPSAWVLLIAPPLVLWNNEFIPLAESSADDPDTQLAGVNR